ncbi:MAG: competence/damage-inducible protein A [Actinomycetota bacterium]
MIVEVVAVGTELLLGQIVNGNAARIGATLAESGFDSHYQQVVGDNLARMVSALQTAMGRADAVVITGGIGPTPDDITREAICGATGREMVHSDEYEAALRARFSALGREMPESNIRQADHPAGAEMLANPKGTAPGLALLHEGVWIFALPGVPEEMEALLTREVVPRLRQAAGIEEVLVSRLLRTWGRSESLVADELGDLFRSVNPSIAFLASGGEIKIRITAKARNESEARRLIEPVEKEVTRRLGGSVFGVDDETIEVVLARLLLERGWTMGTAESVTGGMVAARLTGLAGSSRYFRGAIVAYAGDVKRRLLDVGDMEEGLVSEPTARAMADGARRVLEVDVTVALTGSAGPDPLEEEPGTVVVAVATPDGTRTRTLRLPGDRERVRTYASTAALNLTRLAVTGTWWTTT